MSSLSLTDSYAAKESPYFQVVRKDIEAFLPSTAPRVLEIGCGEGATMRWLRSIRDITYAAGIEFMPERAEIAKSAFDVVLAGDAESIDISRCGNDFDLIIALDVLEHTVNPGLIVEKYSKLLRVGGVFIASIPNIGHCMVSFPLLLRGKWTYADEGILDRTHLRFFDEDGARSLFVDAGLSIDKIGYNYNLSFIGNQAMRWYVGKLWKKILPNYLIISQFVLRAVVPSR